MRRSVVMVLLVAFAVTGCSSEPPDATLKSFIGAWQQGKLNGQSTLVTDSGQPLTGDAAQTQLAAIEADLAAQRPALTIKGKPAVTGDRATATVTVAWPVATGVTWTYDTTVALRRVDDRWRVEFTPKTVQPQLGTGEKLAVKRAAPTRGSILDGAGQLMVTNRPVVVIGLEPRRVADVAVTVKILGDAFASAGLPVGLADVPERLKAAKPDAFVEIAILRRPDFDKIADWLRAAGGLATRETTASLAPSLPFGRALLGTAGEVTKEIMDKRPGKYHVGDIVGLSGLQQRYDDVLRGHDGVTVVIPKPTGTPDVKLFTAAPSSGGTVKTTIDQRVQLAAESALAGVSQRSALVAIRVSDGAILAVANGPGAAANNFALVGQAPPGSTFKTVAALNLLGSGQVGPDTTVPCPRTLAVPGRPPVHNSHDEELGAVPFHVDFAQSCNTAFAALAPKLGDTGLADTARTLGIGIDWDLGTDAFTGKVSTGGSEAERAAAAFGQGTTLVSPVSLAAAAAAVARGQWRQPSLVLDPAPAHPAASGSALNAAALDPLRAMMREVVTSGTAKQLKDLPGDLRGKTGTAEYDDNPAHTHSWFMGYRGDIAFCAFVENGGASTDAAVPIVGTFFRAVG